MKRSGAENLINAVIEGSTDEASNSWLTLIKRVALQYNGYAPTAKVDGVLVSFDTERDLNKFIDHIDKYHMARDWASRNRIIFVSEKKYIEDTNGPWTQW